MHALNGLFHVTIIIVIFQLKYALALWPEKDALKENGEVACHRTKPWMLGHLCVAVCPNDTYEYGTRCVEVCPSLLIEDTNKCVEECPTLTYQDGHRCRYCSDTCDDGCTGPSSNDCIKCSVASASSWSNTCVSYCPANAFFRCHNNDWNMHGSMFCCDKCNRPNDVSVPTERYNDCLGKCPVMLAFVDDSTCVLSCPENKPYTRDTPRGQQCHAECPKHSYHYPGDNHCVNHCNASFPFMYGSSCIKACPTAARFTIGGTECFHQCPRGLVHEIGKFECLASCPRGAHFVFNATCMSHCPDGYQYTLYNNNDTAMLECFEKCPHGTYHVKGYTECFILCPAKWPYVVEERGLCTDMCPPAYPFIANDYCVSRCPSDRLHVSGSYECIFTQCPMDYHLMVKDEGLCVDVCPNNAPYRDQNQCLTSCPQSKAHAAGYFNCNYTCPEDTPFILNHMCVPKCPASQSIVYKGQCLDCCPDSLYYNGTDCAASCPDGLNYVVGCRCYSSCPWGMDTHSGIYIAGVDNNICEKRPGVTVDIRMIIFSILFGLTILMSLVLIPLCQCSQHILTKHEMMDILQKWNMSSELTDSFPRDDTDCDLLQEDTIANANDDNTGGTFESILV